MPVLEQRNSRQAKQRVGSFFRMGTEGMMVRRANSKWRGRGKAGTVICGSLKSGCQYYNVPPTCWHYRSHLGISRWGSVCPLTATHASREAMRQVTRTRLPLPLCALSPQAPECKGASGICSSHSLPQPCRHGVVTACFVPSLHCLFFCGASGAHGQAGI